MASKDQVFEFARQEAIRQGVSPDLVVNMVRTESSGRIDLVSGKGARGPMQLMPATAKELGVNPDDWRDNIRGGVKYINQMLRQFNDPVLAVAAYNAGPGAVRRAGGIPEFKETQNYVQKVLGTNMAREINAQELGLQFGQPQPQAPVQPQMGGPREVDLQALNLNFGMADQPAPVQQSQPATLGSNITSGLREFGRQLGLTARIGVEGLGTALDIGAAPISNLINLATGAQTTQPASASMARVADVIGLPKPQGDFERSIQNIGKTVAATAAGTGAGRLLAAPLATGLAGQTATQAVGAGLAAQPAAQLAAATGGSGTAEVARNVFDVQDPFALGGLSLLGGLATGSVASRLGNVQTGTQYRDPVTGQLVEAGRLRGLNVEAGDVGVGGGTIRNLRNVGGTTEDALSQRQGEITRLIDRTATNAQPTGIKAGTESKVVAKDLRTQYNTAKKNVAPLFDNARKLAGDQPIPITRAQAAINQVLDQIPDTAETNIIMRNINRLQNLAEGGGTYKEIRDVSSNIGSELSRVSKGIPGGSYSPAQQSAIKGLYDALSEDVDAWAAPRQINGKPVYTPAGAAHERAMEQFRQTVAPFRQDQDIFRVVSSRTFGDDYDRAATNFVNKLTSNNETADLSMNLMSDKGQKAAQFKILNDARSAALGVDPKTPSIDQFNRSLNLGLADNPTPQRTILARNPELLNEVSTTTGLLNTVRQGLDQTQQSPFLPYAGRAATGGLVGFLGSQAGLGPVGAGALGTGTALLAPQVTNLLTDAATSLPATRFILGQPNLGTAGATGLTAAQLAEIQRQSEIPRIEVTNLLSR
jgi:hypothetical protein